MDNKIVKNDEYEIEITGMGIQGEGVGKIDNFTIFIPGAIEGERVLCKIVKVNKNYGFGKIEEIITPSESRTAPPCSIYKNCGGCNLQHMNYDAQLNFKKNRVRDCLTRIGKVSGEVKIYDTIGMDKPYYYRNKAQLPIGFKDGKATIGFYKDRTHEIIDMKDVKCHIQHESFQKVIEVVLQWINKYSIPVYNEEKNTGLLRHLMIRKGFTTGEIMVVLVTNGNSMPYTEELITTIKDSITEIKSIVQNINMEKTNVILGKKNKILFGDDHITDYIGTMKYKISPLSFFQVNPKGTEKLYSKALEYASLTGSETVFDAYCGAGTISLFLSQHAKKVYGVEIVPEAIEDAKENAKLNGIVNTEFIEGKSEEVIPELIKKGIKADVVVVDPPRKGCEKQLLEAIANMEPERIVYVSCDPGTLARDLNILQGLGYETVEVQPVDMFPQTGHVEVVVGIRRKDSL